MFSGNVGSYFPPNEKNPTPFFTPPPPPAIRSEPITHQSNWQSRDDHEDGEYQRAIQASQESYRANELSNQRLLFDHMDSNRRDSGFRDDLIVREEDEDDFERLTPLDVTSGNPLLDLSSSHQEEDGGSTSEDEIMQRVKQLSLLESQKGEGHSDEWERYDPSAFGDNSSTMVVSPMQSIAASPSPPSNINQSLHPPDFPPMARVAPDEPGMPVADLTLSMDLTLLPPPTYSRQYSRSQPSSPPSSIRPELLSGPSYASAPEIPVPPLHSSPSLVPRSHSASISSTHHSSPVIPTLSIPISALGGSSPILGPSSPPHAILTPIHHNPRIASNYRHSVAPSAFPSPSRDHNRTLRSSASHGNLSSKAHLHQSLEPVPPTPALPLSIQRPASASVSRVDEIASSYNMASSSRMPSGFVQSVVSMQSNSSALTENSSVASHPNDSLGNSTLLTPSATIVKTSRTWRGRSKSQTPPPRTSLDAWAEGDDMLVNDTDDASFASHSGEGPGSAPASVEEHEAGMGGGLSVPTSMSMAAGASSSSLSRPPLAAFPAMSYLGDLMTGVCECICFVSSCMLCFTSPAAYLSIFRYCNVLIPI